MTSANGTTLRATLLSLIATPWLLMVSTSSGLYLRNQADLQYRVDVLYPFIGAALLIYLVGLLLAALVAKHKAFGTLLWAYYLLAPLFIVLQSINASDSATPGLALGVLAVALYFGSTLVLNRVVALEKAAPAIALAGCALVAVDTYLFIGGFDGTGPDTGGQPVASHQAADSDSPPNIYHLVLDEYQTDMFKLTLSEEVRRKLSGFTFYEQATALFGRTEMSLPSVFSGKNYDFESPPVDYQKAGFSLESSIFGPLKDHGYETRAIMYPVFSFEPEGFDYISFHPPVRSNSYRLAVEFFFKVWSFSVLPLRVSRLFMDASELDQLKHKNLLAVSAPVQSYENMLKIIAAEKNLQSRGRYQFIHLLLPHFPYVLSRDCEYRPSQRTSPAEQSRCTTTLITDFIDTLKQLERFRDSLIIVQSDHGARFEIRNGDLKGFGENSTSRFGAKYARARARSLLLVKPPGKGAEAAFEVSGAPVSLLDIAPTIIQSTGMPSSLAFDGRPLLDPGLNEGSGRDRYYYFYNKLGSRGRHIVKMTRYRIEDGGLVNEGLVGSGEFK